MRKHGCEWPLNVYQVVAATVYAGLVTGYYTVFFPFIDHKPMRIFTAVLYGVVAFAVAGLNIYCSVVDPADPGVHGKPHETENGKDDYFCVLCQVKVKKRSKHCRTCDKCVDLFDHHCKWLNNCVGCKNYRGFLFLVGVTLGQIFLQFVTGLYIFVLCFKEKDDMRRLLEDSFASSLDLTSLTVLLGVYLAILLAASVLLGELFFFHQLLRMKNLTTYDYILLERDRSRREHRARVAAREDDGDLEGGDPPKGLRGVAVACGCAPAKVAPRDNTTPRLKVPISTCRLAQTPARLPGQTPRSVDTTPAQSVQNTPRVPLSARDGAPSPIAENMEYSPTSKGATGGGGGGVFGGGIKDAGHGGAGGLGGRGGGGGGEQAAAAAGCVPEGGFLGVSRTPGSSHESAGLGVTGGGGGAAAGGGGGEDDGGGGGGGGGGDPEGGRRPMPPPMPLGLPGAPTDAVPERRPSRPILPPLDV